ncbi:response regulator [Aurantiacibacter sp. MUD61]|uniref:response regulator n=1 Tax=Aurantiacibacter sp. MUD61 TaxID=3009083 RepID=UPI0022F0F881|nr:response regulator [Aurantiacibacter sp. MUD61]
MKKFLVLEDEPFIAMDLVHAFEDAGFSSVSAVDNDEAAALIEKNDLSGAVLDVSLGGGKTCERTAAMLNDCGIPFILHTGDLDRAGERLRRFDVPVVAKPQPSDLVVKRLLSLLEDPEKVA